MGRFTEYVKAQTEKISEANRAIIKEYLIALGAVAAISIMSNWVGTAGMYMTRGVYDMISGGIKSNVDIRLGISAAISFISALLMMLFYISFRRDRFTWGDAEQEWRGRRKKFCFRHIAAYFVFSLPVNLYYLIMGLDSVFGERAYTPGMNLDIKSMAEPWWMGNFFNPECAFFRLTRSMALGILLNLLLMGLMIWFSCYRKKKNQ